MSHLFEKTLALVLLFAKFWSLAPPPTSRSMRIFSMFPFSLQPAVKMDGRRLIYKVAWNLFLCEVWLKSSEWQEKGPRDQTAVFAVRGSTVFKTEEGASSQEHNKEHAGCFLWHSWGCVPYIHPSGSDLEYFSEVSEEEHLAQTTWTVTHWNMIATQLTTLKGMIARFQFGSVLAVFFLVQYQKFLIASCVWTLSKRIRLGRNSGSLWELQVNYPLII